MTDDRPKALVEVGDETMLGRAVRLLLEHGVKELVLATGYREDAVRAAMAGCPVPVRYCRNDAFDRTQNSVSLWLCREAIGDRSFVKLDGDLLFEPAVLPRLATGPAGVVAAVDRRPGLGAEEMKVMTEGDRITAFGKHLDPARSAGESIGIERVSGVAVSRLFHSLGRVIGTGQTGLYYEDVYALLPDEGVDLWAVDVSDLGWCEVDTPDDLATARAQIAGWAQRAHGSRSA
ncbi:MAG: phosphocholine cytidylyltransferase family protein [Myxococcales bacterium]|nr:MAG: phosphocholine cytidylyltransferase family protein [Myxococcales bacterium]